MIEYGWSAYDPDAPSETRDNGDPLGLRAWATRIARRLVPVFTQQHRSLWGFAWLCAGRRLAGEAATVSLSRDEAWLRLEATWVHAQTRHRLLDPTVPPWPGLKKAEKMAQLKRLRVDKEARLLRHELTQGSWGTYRRGATRLGLVRAEGLGAGFSPSTTALTAAGSDVAQLFVSVFLGSRGHGVLLDAARAGELDASRLAAIPAAGLPMPELRERIGGCVQRVEGALEIAALRRTFDADIHAFPSVVRISDSFLTAGQRDALRSARAARRLVEEIEFGYRRWMLGDSPPESTIWDDDGPWACALADQEAEVLELRRWGRAHGWQGVHRWQRELARRRGSRALERSEVPEYYVESRPPSFGLPSLGGLFAEGLLGEPRLEYWRTVVRSDEDEG
jgi:hypothetical protein